MRHEFIKNLKSYMYDFVHEEDGNEMLQYAIIVAVSAGLIAVIVYLATKIGQKIGEAGDQVDALDTKATVNSNPYNSTGGDTNVTPES